ncbi:hypothetical protein RJ641_024331 [Dillenia turbinata]|uniref:PX domain-containing protein n=1 Tax=Dillenia turbinata TaxID=194707 RepID=A0AAN8UKC8_9MAGN
MNVYGQDLTLLHLGFSDHPIIESLSNNPSISSSVYESTPDQNQKRSSPPPKHRHDGTSPLPLGMDWSPPPRKWFYRVQVGIQSPDGVTTIRGILRRFSDFLRLFAELLLNLMFYRVPSAISYQQGSKPFILLKKAFPKKYMPTAPPKRLLKTKSRTLVEERRCSLEDWLEKLLSDIDLSRTFEDPNVKYSDVFSSPSIAPVSSDFHLDSDVSLAVSSAIASDSEIGTPNEDSEIGTPRWGSDLVSENLTSEQGFSPQETSLKYGISANANSLLSGDFSLQRFERFFRRKLRSKIDNDVIDRENPSEDMPKDAVHFGVGSRLASEMESQKLTGHARRLSADSVASDVSSMKASEISNFGDVNSFADPIETAGGTEASRSMDAVDGSGLQFPGHLVVALPSDERQRIGRVLTTVQRRLVTAKTDMEDLLSRLNQELAVKQYLTMKVKDLEVELEATKHSCKESMQQSVFLERERFTQMQWDVEELRRKCLELELKLKSEQDERVRAEVAKESIVQENEMLLQELDVAREQYENLQKHQEEQEAKSKADVKLLVKEVKSLRTSQSELKQELSRLITEKIELEKLLQNENLKKERANTANEKLLHECEILRNRLQECSVNFLIEEEDKLTMDTSSASDALDLLTTSDNRIGLLLAEAQLLAQDVENAVAAADGHGGKRSTDDEVRKMLTDVFIDNATLRKQVNTVMRCALSTAAKSEKDEEEEEVPIRKTNY